MQVRGVIAGAIAMTMLSVACGTRLDDAAFEVGAPVEDGAPPGPSTGDEPARASSVVPLDGPDSGAFGDLADLERSGVGGTAPGGTGSGAGEGRAAGRAGSGTATGDGGGATDPGAGAATTGAPDDPDTSDPAAPDAGTSGSDGDEPSAARAPNEASDVGVTPDELVVGNITSVGGPLGPYTYSPMYYGANAYFGHLNDTEGGIHGRRVRFVTCDDRENPAGNYTCAQQLVEDDEVFALVANATSSYSAAEFVSDAGVPDVAGQPIGGAYDTYPGLFAVTGTSYERDGEVGDHGTMYNFTGLYNWFRRTLGFDNAAVLYYSIPISKQYGTNIARSLRMHGVEVVEYEVNIAFPNFDSIVADMQARGVEAIFDTMDNNANLNLCNAMERRTFAVTAKVANLNAWRWSVKDTYPQICRDALYVWGKSVSFGHVANPEVARFRRVMAETYDEQLIENVMAQWAFEGWLAAMQFHRAVELMGATPTRVELIEYLDTLQDASLGGLMAVDTNWIPNDWDDPPDRSCFSVARWSDAAGEFTQVNPTDQCDLPGQWFAFTPP